MKRPTTNKKQHETTYNDLRRPITNTKRPWSNPQRARNNLRWLTTSKTQPTTTQTYLQQAKKWRETINNKQILRLFYKMGQLVFFSNTFSTQHLVTVIQALLHRELWWKWSAKYFHIIMCIYFGYKIYTILTLRTTLTLLNQHLQGKSQPYELRQKSQIST